MNFEPETPRHRGKHACRFFLQVVEPRDQLLCWHENILKALSQLLKFLFENQNEPSRACGLADKAFVTHLRIKLSHFNTVASSIEIVV